jgi:membrane protein YdbS with pleckstrin-like domain
MISEIDKILDPSEKIFWRGKPKYIAVILKCIPVTIFGLFWCSFLIPFYWAFFTGKFPIFIWAVLGPHTLIGVGMLGAPLWATLVYPYIEYAITSKRIIIKSGFFARNFQTVDYVNLTDVSVNIGPIGRLTNSGDILFISGMGIFTEKTGKNSISCIENPYEVFKLLKQVYFDIKTDVEFPNKLRPPVNPGYQSEYQPFRQ